MTSKTLQDIFRLRNDDKFPLLAPLKDQPSVEQDGVTVSVNQADQVLSVEEVFVEDAPPINYE